MAEKPAGVVCDGDVCRRMTPEEEAAAGAAAPSGVGNVPTVFQVLGSSLLGQGGAEVPVSSITGPNKVVALYFSAHWCPPCRGFTPHLATTYRRFKESHARKADWEVVFVSSDRDEAAFAEYFAEMPWTALPFGKREAKAELSKMFKVRGIPTLILLDGETGEVINANGREVLSEDEECENFPWRPRTFAQIMEGATLVPEPGAPSSAPAPSALEHLAGKVTLLYFSASWCPPCRRFTPKLVETFKALRAAGQAVEAVFVSGDREADKMAEYHSRMAFPALPFEDRKRAAELNSKYEVEGIPTLVVLDEAFNVITTEGVGAVSADPAGKRFPWHPQPLEPLSPYTAPRINAGPVLLLVLDAPDDGAAEALAEAALRPVAEKVTRGSAAAGGGGGSWAFLWARRGDELATSVLGFAGLVVGEGEEAEAPAGHSAVLLDVPGKQAVWDLGKRGVEATSAEALGQAVEDYLAGRLGPGAPVGGRSGSQQQRREPRHQKEHSGCRCM